MPVDASLIGRTFAPTAPLRVEEEHVARFAASIGQPYGGGPAPATYPIVLAFEAMSAFLDDLGLDLSRIVHGEQRFAYERPVLPGDVLSATLSVTTLRQIGGNDIIGTTSEVLDAEGAKVCATSATLVHRGSAGPSEEHP